MQPASEGSYDFLSASITYPDRFVVESYAKLDEPLPAIAVSLISLLSHPAPIPKQ